MTEPTSKKIPTDRPAELVAFFAMVGPVYSWLVDRFHAPTGLALVLAVVVGLVPLVVSTVKDARGPGDTPYNPPPAVDPEHERLGIDHHDEGRAAGRA